MRSLDLISKEETFGPLVFTAAKGGSVAEEPPVLRRFCIRDRTAGVGRGWLAGATVRAVSVAR